MGNTSQPSRRPLYISYLWNAASSAYAALVVGASVLALSITIFTGQNFTQLTQATAANQNVVAAVDLALCISFALFIATFLIGYALNGNKWGLGAWVLMVFATSASPHPSVVVMTFVPFLLGAIASYYFNRFCLNSHVSTRERVGRLSFVTCRYGTILVCGISLLIFVTPSELSFLLIAIFWIVKLILMTSGSLRNLWAQAPVNLAA